MVSGCDCFGILLVDTAICIISVLSSFWSFGVSLARTDTFGSPTATEAVSPAENTIVNTAINKRVMFGRNMVFIILTYGSILRGAVSASQAIHQNAVVQWESSLRFLRGVSTDVSGPQKSLRETKPG